MLRSSGCWEAAAWLGKLCSVGWGTKGQKWWMDDLGEYTGHLGCDTVVFPPVKAKNLGHS